MFVVEMRTTDGHASMSIFSQDLPNKMCSCMCFCMCLIVAKFHFLENCHGVVVNTS